MIKVFTKNANGNIELSPKELQELLDQNYWDGYREGLKSNYIYASPKDYWTCSSSTTCDHTVVDFDYNSPNRIIVSANED